MQWCDDDVIVSEVASDDGRDGPRTCGRELAKTTEVIVQGVAEPAFVGGSREATVTNARVVQIGSRIFGDQSLMTVRFHTEHDDALWRGIEGDGFFEEFVG